MMHSYDSMNVAYGIRRLNGDLIVVGAVQHTKPNSVKLTVNKEIIRVGAVGPLGNDFECRGFMLLAPASLSSWDEAQIPDLTDAPIETKMWSNPLGKRVEHRPCTFRGYPIRANIIVLLPQVPDLTKFEPAHEGFIERYRDAEGFMTTYYPSGEAPRCPCDRAQLTSKIEQERGRCDRCECAAGLPKPKRRARSLDDV